MPHCMGLLLLSPLWPNQVPHVVSLIFFLEINFYINGISFFVGSDKAIIMKVNIRLRLEFRLIYNKFAVQYVSDNATGTLTSKDENISLNNLFCLDA